jgi:hypothetical protein
MTHENTGLSREAAGTRNADDARAALRAAATPPWSGLQRSILVLGFVLFPAPLFAIITISVQSIPGSRPIDGGVLLDFGNVSAFESLASGVSRTIGASNYTISTGLGIRVTKIVGGSSSYTLQARLQSAHALTWQLDGVTMSTSAATVATLQPYATTIPHTLAFVVPFSYAAGAVATVFEVTAIAN